MSYSDFTIQEAIRRFQLTLCEDIDLFSPVDDIQPSELLQDTLSENIPLALAIQTEKARSELITMPTFRILFQKLPCKMKHLIEISEV